MARSNTIYVNVVFETEMNNGNKTKPIDILFVSHHRMSMLVLVKKPISMSLIIILILMRCSTDDCLL